MNDRSSGWYDDPHDETKLRYWDGILWSDRTMPKLRPGLDHVGEARPVHHVDPPSRRDGEPRTYPAHWGPEETGRTEHHGQWGPYGRPPGNRDQTRGADRPRSSHAGLGRRVVAAILDWIIVSFLVSIVASPFLHGTSERLSEFNRQQMDALRSGSTQPPIPHDVLAPAFALLGAVAAVLVVYDAVMTARRGQTLGRMAMSTKVTGEQGAEVSFGRALVRSILKWVGAVVGPFGMILGAVVLLPALGSAKRQGLHDRATDTEVHNS